jgi:hypothetical protein
MPLPTTPGSSPELAAALDRMKGQLLIVLVNRLGGEISIPVSEIDATGGWMLDLEVQGTDFNFKTSRKQ